MAAPDDPFRSADRVERPRPGGGRQEGGSSSPPPPPGSYTPEPPGAPIPSVFGISANPLVEAAGPLLLLTAQLRSSQAAMDVPGLRRQALDEINRFEERARRGGVQPEIVLVTRYALCAGLDEAVLSTPWGYQSDWAEHSLLLKLHREQWGGEKFFDMVDRLSTEPDRYIDLLELHYLELALGFTGKYHDKGQDQLADLRHSLYRTIQQRREAPEDRLSARWRGLEDRRNRLVRYVPWWVMAAALFATLGVTFAVYHLRLAAMAEPLQIRLATMGVEDLAETPAPVTPVAGPTLKQLLRSEEDAGTMRVVENGPQTVVTLLGAAELFRSASAEVNPAYKDVIGRVADALNRVPGRVQIIGHTDDQPVRTLAFDNVELSRARAVNVANALKERIENPGRLSSKGLGASNPLYLPASTPENRARNRRVEIVHHRGL